MVIVGTMLYTMNVTCLKCGSVYAVRHETKKKLEEIDVKSDMCSGCNCTGALRSGSVEFRRKDLHNDVANYLVEINRMKCKIREIHLIIEINQDERTV